MLIEADAQTELSVLSENNQTPAIYNKYFGFLQIPFSSLPKKQFFFKHESASQMVNTLTFSLRSGESIIKVTGDSGVGKTYLIRQVLSSLSEHFFFIHQSSPNMSPNMFLKNLVEDLGAAYPLDANDGQLIKYIRFLLCEHYSKTEYPVVIWVDDAHKLSANTMDVILALSKMETPHRSLLQFILSGTCDLDKKLASESMADFRNKILFSATIENLNFFETKSYVSERLATVSETDTTCFSQSAISALYKKTSGNPAKINQLSHKSLMLAFGKGDSKVDKRHVWQAAASDMIKEKKKGRVYLFSWVFIVSFCLVASFSFLSVNWFGI